ncbi:MAG TPA: amidohydrolase family protein [Bryobacteraceae bacterium]|nr:amidohydrolase family protein [Bryobacteraceae bacterium]HUO30991.1 amidohydrolase family protein [Bryobacteraceae bacterium]
MLRPSTGCLPLALCLTSILSSQPSTTAIVDINVVDVVRGEIHYGQTVVITGGRIQAIVPSGNAQIPAGAFRVPGEGRYLMPGLWDMHVHLRSDRKNPAIRLAEENAAMLDLFLPNGITGIREMGGDLSDKVLQWRDEIAAGKRTGPRILTAGRKIDQEPPAWPGSLGVKTEPEAREAVRQVKQSGADFVKIYFSDVSPEVLHAVIDEAHKLHLRVTGHKPINMSIQEFIETGADGMEHAQYLPAAEREEYDRFAKERAHRRDTPWAMDAVETSARLLAMEDSKQSEAVYHRMAEKQFWVTPTLTVYEHEIEQASRDYEQDARKQYIFPSIWASWDAKSGARTTRQGRALELRKLSFKRWQDDTLAAHKAGVPMLLGTDSGTDNSHTIPGWSIHEELEALVKAGLSPVEALRMGTIDAARWRGQDATEGSVEAGKVADLVILRSNPLEAIRHTQEIDAVFKNGKLFSRVDLDEMLHAVEDQVKAAQ